MSSNETGPLFHWKYNPKDMFMVIKTSFNNVPANMTSTYNTFGGMLNRWNAAGNYNFANMSNIKSTVNVWCLRSGFFLVEV